MTVFKNNFDDYKKIQKRYTTILYSRFTLHPDGEQLNEGTNFINCDKAFLQMEINKRKQHQFGKNYTTKNI